MFIGIGLICIPIVLLSYSRINRQRDVLHKSGLENGGTNKYTVQELRQLGDRADGFMDESKYNLPGGS